MKKSFFGGVLAAALLVGAPAMAGGAKDKQAKAQGKLHELKALENTAPQRATQEVKDTVKRFERAWNAHDIDKMTEVYTEDAAMMTPMFAASGKQQIREKMQSQHQNEMKDSRITMEVESVRQLSPQLVIADLKQRFENVPQDMPQELHVSVVLNKQGQNWKAKEVRAFQPASEQPQQGVGGAGQPMEEPAPMPEQQEQQPYVPGE